MTTKLPMTRGLSQHERTQSLYSIYTYGIGDSIKPSCPEWIRDRIMRSKCRTAAKRAAREALDCRYYDGPAYDYRGWQRDGRRLGPGSGRAADWLDSGFRRLAAIARAVHEHCGYRDDECRRIARVLHRYGHAQGWEMLETCTRALSELPPCTIDPTFRARGYYSHDPVEEEAIERDFASRGGSESATKWRLFVRWTVEGD